MRQLIASGAPWEPVVGYSRAVRVGSVVEVASTTAQHYNVYAQTRRALEKIGEALAAARASFADVVRTRIFVTDIS